MDFFKEARAKIAKEIRDHEDRKIVENLKQLAAEEKDDIYCMECKEEFQGDYPRPGESVMCPNCKAEGYGTYDNTPDMGYTIEWYPSDPVKCGLCKETVGSNKYEINGTLFCKDCEDKFNAAIKEESDALDLLLRAMVK